MFRSNNTYTNRSFLLTQHYTSRHRNTYNLHSAISIGDYFDESFVVVLHLSARVTNNVCYVKVNIRIHKTVQLLV